MNDDLTAKSEIFTYVNTQYRYGGLVKYYLRVAIKLSKYNTKYYKYTRML